MNRAEFMACSLAFHAALLVVAVLLPAPFPSRPAYTSTDLTYVEVGEKPERAASGNAPEPEKAAAFDLESLDPDIRGRLALAVPEGLVLKEDMAGMGERIRAAASAGRPVQSTNPNPGSSNTGNSETPPREPAKAAERAGTGSPESGTSGAGRAEADEAGEPAPPGEAPVQVRPELAADAAMDSPAGRVATDRKSLNFKCQAGWPPPAMLSVDVDAGGAGRGTKWSARPDRDWIIVAPKSGQGTGRIKAGVLASGLETGYHEGTITLTGDEPGSGECELAVTLMVLPEDPGRPELPHFAWDDYMDGGCQVCHLPKELMPSADFMMRPEFCGLCHNPAGMASGSLPGPGGHPVMVNVTSGRARFPTGGAVEGGAYSDKMSTHLLGGDKVVCVTCHNVMYKPGDYGRTWELASAGDGKNYRLARGGWAGMGYLVPKVYVTRQLAPPPDRLSGLGTFMVSPSGYEYDEAEGLIRFKEPPVKGSFVYVTLSNPYLRMPTANNAMCYDCHSQNTHQGMNCLVCHAAHGTSNIMAVRENIRIPGGSVRRVAFRAYSGGNSFAGGGGVPSGVCEVCHTKTSVHKNGGGRPAHRDGTDYTGSDCTRCHGHDAGFTADVGGTPVAVIPAP